MYYIMNPSWVKTQADRNKVYREYMASLKLEESNINKTANAIKTQELTGASPAPLDTRTTTEKYMDINRLRNELQSGLYDIMSPDEASKVVSQLTEDEIQFGRTQIKAIVKDLKPKFELGVPSIVFINYLRKLLQQFIQTEGVENAVGQQASVPTNSLLASFADIRAIRANLERLQQTINQVQRQMNIPPTSTELVPYNRLNDSIQNALFLLPSPDELDYLRGVNVNLRGFVYDAITDLERYFPNESTINDIIRNLLIASRTGDRNAIEDIIDSINREIFISQEQEDALKQIQEYANAETEESQKKSEELALRKESVSKNKSGMLSKLERRQAEERQAGGQRLEIENVPQAETQESPTKSFKIADKELTDSDTKKIEAVEYKPITREEFIKLSQMKKEGYIAKALIAGDIPQGTAFGFVNEKDENDNFYKAIITPKLILTNFREGEGGQKRRPRHTASQLIDIYDRYLEGKSITQNEPIEEFSTPSRQIPRSSMSVVSQNTPAGVASTFAPQGDREKKGRGIRGRGLGRNRVEGRIEREPEPRSTYSFAPFGRYIINTNKLQKGICSINTKTGKSLPRLKSKIITKKLTEIFKEIAKGNEITNEKTDGLTDDEIDTLYNTLNECHLLSKYNTPTSQDLSKTESELNRFMILKGQISAGQNNKDVVREFKALLLKYIKKGQIPKSEGYDILEELLVLGY